jgi:hypothetical protein
LQKNSQWQWGVIFVSIFTIVALLFAVSFLLNSNENNASNNSTSNSSQQEDTSQGEENNEEATPEEESPAEIVVSEKVETGEYVQILTLVAKLEVKDEEKSDSYSRDRFRHWVNVEGKCSARQYTLREESLIKVSYSDEAECVVSSGKWLSLYDGVTLTDPSGVDIDHMVPLKEAWESGAHSWNDAKRRSYANDIGDPRSLIAVSAKSNRSKSDRDPQDWMPTEKSYTCTYIADWVAVKYRWNLSIDMKEREALISYAEECVDEPVLVPEKG